MLPSNLRVPTSAVLLMDDPRRQLTGTTLTARLAVYTIYDTVSIRIGGQQVPLEYDQTAVRALFATEGKGWTQILLRQFKPTSTGYRLEAPNAEAD